MSELDPKSSKKRSNQSYSKPRKPSLEEMIPWVNQLPLPPRRGEAPLGGWLSHTDPCAPINCFLLINPISVLSWDEHRKDQPPSYQSPSYTRTPDLLSGNISMPEARAGERGLSLCREEEKVTHTRPSPEAPATKFFWDIKSRKCWGI